MGRIIIVEDEAILRKHLGRLFEREGYEVVTAGSRAEALVQLRHGPFGALLLDLMLPDGDGLDLLAELGVYRPLQTVVMTACSTPERELRARQLNVCRVLRKPLDLLQLIETVRRVAPRPGCVLPLCEVAQAKDCLLR
jgi:DNA-binding response OmpR family regulator